MPAKSRIHTHTGECQICGRVQAVRPGSNLMAKHGYTVDWGCFSGTCWGADHLPLQLSKDLLDKAIQLAHSRIADRQAQIQKERDKNPTHGHVSLWVQGKGFGSKGRYWTVGCEFRDIAVPYPGGGGSYNRVEAFALVDDPITHTQAGQQVGYDHSALLSGLPNAHAVALQSREKAIDELQGEISHHERYIAWQEGRKRDWKPRELTPVAAEPEKQAFNAGDVLPWQRPGALKAIRITLTRLATGMSGQRIGWWAQVDGWSRERRFTTRELRAMTHVPTKQ